LKLSVLPDGHEGVIGAGLKPSASSESESLKLHSRTAPPRSLGAREFLRHRRDRRYLKNLGRHDAIVPRLGSGREAPSRPAARKCAPQSGYVLIAITDRYNRRPTTGGRLTRIEPQPLVPGASTASGPMNPRPLSSASTGSLRAELAWLSIPSLTLPATPPLAGGSCAPERRVYPRTDQALV
jgi:hypothetical protein